jgi:hypothetical protein
MNVSRSPPSGWHQVGGGMYNRRVRSDLELSCETVREIEAAMSKRRRKTAEL